VTTPRPLRDGDVVTLAGHSDLTLTFDAGGETVTVGRDALPGGGLWVDPRAAEVWLRGRKLEFHPAAYRALALLYERAGEVVDPDAIAARARPEQDGAASVATVDRLIGGLRAVIEPEPGAPRLLRSEPGGYRLAIV
jgi:DNA-binding response OmpR family regulator